MLYRVLPVEGSTLSRLADTLHSACQDRFTLALASVIVATNAPCGVNVIVETFSVHM